MPNAVPADQNQGAPADQNQAESNELTQEQRDASMMEVKEKFFERLEDYREALREASSFDELKGVLKSFAAKSEGYIPKGERRLYSDPSSDLTTNLSDALRWIDQIKEDLESKTPEELQNPTAAGARGGKALAEGKGFYYNLYDKVVELADKRIAEKISK